MIELVLVVIVLSTAILYFPSRITSPSNYEEMENMKNIGYTLLSNLDNQGILSQNLKINSSNSNFSVITNHIESSLTALELAKVEYILSNSDYSSVYCLNGSGEITVCGELTKKPRELISTSVYTYGKQSEPISIKLYLRRYLI